MGWMPTAVDLSSWNSLWTLERMKQTNYKPKLKETLFEFRLAYHHNWNSCSNVCDSWALLSSMALEKNYQIVIHFLHTRVVTLYTQTIGDWSYIIIAASAFTVMFGTILAVFDGYSRSLQRTVELIFIEKKVKIPVKLRILYIFFLLVIWLLALL